MSIGNSEHHTRHIDARYWFLRQSEGSDGSQLQQTFVLVDTGASISIWNSDWLDIWNSDWLDIWNSDWVD